MAAPRLNGILERLRTLAGLPKSRDLTDTALLERFVESRDEAAYTVLLERHGPAILGVCRRALGCREDAEDACQAVFLILARKAGSVRSLGSLSSWLHGVARRVSTQLKREQARRQRREQAVVRPDAKDAAADISWREMQAALDDELEQVPPRLRAPLILCYLHGKTRDEAAKDLGVSSGSLHGLLERGRRLLRQRLTRRGITLSAVLFSTMLGEGAGQAALTPTFIVSSAKAAALFAAGKALDDGAISAQVLSLTHGVLKTMFLAKAKLGMVALVACALTALVGGAFSSAGAQDPKGKDVIGKIVLTTKDDVSDEAFIRRLSKDLRGIAPSRTEVHFFLASKDPEKRQKLVDLFVKEREEKKTTEARGIELLFEGIRLEGGHGIIGSDKGFVIEFEFAPPERLGGLQKDFFKELRAAKGEKDVARVTQSYLDRLVGYVSAHPKNADVRDAIQQIAAVYESQGKTVEARAWRERLKGHLEGAAKTPAKAP